MPNDWMIRLPISLKEQVQAEARRDGRTPTNYIANVLRREVFAQIIGAGRTDQQQR